MSSVRERWISVGREAHADAEEVSAQGFIGSDGKQGPAFFIPVALIGRIPSPPPGWMYDRDGYAFLNDAIAATGSSRRYLKTNGPYR